MILTSHSHLLLQVLGCNELDTRGVRVFYSAIQSRHASARPPGSWQFLVEVEGQRFRSASAGGASEGMVAMQGALTSVLDAGSARQRPSRPWNAGSGTTSDSDSSAEDEACDGSDACASES